MEAALAIIAGIIGTITGVWFLWDKTTPHISVLFRRQKSEFYPEEVFRVIDDSPYTVARATYDDLVWISEKSIELYGEHGVPLSVRALWYKKNPFAFWVIRNRIGRLAGCCIAFPVAAKVIRDLATGKTHEQDKKSHDIFTRNNARVAQYVYLENVMAILDDNTPNVWAFKALLDNLTRVVETSNLNEDAMMYAMAAKEFRTKKGIFPSNAARLMEKIGFISVAANTIQKLPLYRIKIFDLMKNIKRLRRD